MDVVTYILAKKAAGSGEEALEKANQALEEIDALDERLTLDEEVIDSLKSGLKYKGEVDYYNDLLAIANPKEGWCYTVKYKGTEGDIPCGDEYVYGKYHGENAWIRFGGDIDSYIKTASYDVSTNTLTLTDDDGNEYAITAATHEEVTDAIATALEAYTTTADLTDLLADKQDTIDDLETIRSQASSALQPHDNISELTNDVGYITAAQVEGQIQADWDQTDTEAVDYIKNKPTDLGDFENETGYIKKDVSDLDNYTDNTDLELLLSGKEDADATIVKDANYEHITVTNSSVSDGTNTFSQYVLPSDVVQDENYAHITVDATNGVSDGTNTYKYTQSTLTIDEAGTTKTYNGSSAVSITIPGVDDFAEKDKAVGSFKLTIDSSTYVLSLQAKDVNGDNLGNAETIDLPLESMVVGGSYDAENKQLVLELKSGDTIEIPIDDIIAGLQEEITDDNKLDADLVDDTNADNKFISAQEKQDIADNTSARHTHSNKALLDTYAQTEADLADAVDKKHSHSNKAVLDDITAAQIEQIGTNTQSITDILNGASIDSFGDVETALDDKQDTLVSGTNIKTLNEESLLGTGNISIDAIAPTITIGDNSYSSDDGDIELPTSQVTGLSIDATPTEGSDNLVTSGGVYAAIQGASPVIVQDLTSSVAFTITAQDWADLKTNHYIIKNNTPISGLINTYEFVNIKFEINNTTEYAKLSRNKATQYIGILNIEENNSLYELVLTYKDNTIIVFRCAQVY